MSDEMSEKEFLKSYDPDQYKRPGVAADAILFGFDDGALKTVLIRRKNHPYRGHWVFPGGFIEVYEDPNDAVLRELREETGVKLESMTQFGVFGKPDRDPRYHVISIAYFGVVLPKNTHPKGADDAADAAWFPVYDTPPLGFDHPHVLEVALTRIRAEIRRISFALQFLREGFNGREIRSLYQAVLDEKLDGARFLSRLGAVCETPPRMDEPVRIDVTKLRRFEERLGKWWLEQGGTEGE